MNNNIFSKAIGIVSLMLISQIASAAPVPEPETLSLWALGAGALAFVKWRGRKRG
ncbi:PEP-CTERM sorting domain-containing protein [Methylomagnum ishizawai]|uniref:PEP-CTERM sorting domain-containing protein n=1 Tax=Methylomagnum ishizawai TaxID=1760988 RepID=UPI001C31F8D1|nr:PEP-CTERM sorting domain-containing protein [Methylomagnum ishizawai]BBL74637.1 hypothetical protein MishRS11D_17350 [Methylomagnum ishizawai]